MGLWLTVLGAKVTGIGLRPTTDPNLFTQPQLEERLEASHNTDIRDYQELKEVIMKSQPEVVIHLAAQPLVRQSYRDP